MKKRSNILLIIVICLLIINAFILLAKFDLFQDDGRLNSEQKALCEKHGIALDSTETKYTLLIIFGVDDCISCMEEARYWNKLAKLDNLDVIGIGYHEFEDEFWKAIPNYNFEFDVLFDGGASFKRKFGPKRSTPFKVLLQGDKIILKDDPNMYQVAQKAIYEEITDIVG